MKPFFILVLKKKNKELPIMVCNTLNEAKAKKKYLIFYLNRDTKVMIKQILSQGDYE